MCDGLSDSAGSDGELFRGRHLLAEKDRKLCRNEDNSDPINPINVFFIPKKLKHAVHPVPGESSVCLWFMFMNHSHISVIV